MGNPRLVSGIVINIDERKKTEAALFESEINYRKLVENSPDVIYKYSIVNGGLFYSGSVEQILGYTPDEILTSPSFWQDKIHPDDKPLVKDAINGLLKGQECNVEYRIRTKTGSWKWMNDCVMLSSSKAGDTVFEGRAIDITGQKLMEQELRVFSRSVDQSPVSIVITDPDGLIRYVNSKFTQLTGYSAKEIYGRNPSLLKTGYTSKEEYDILWKTIKSGNEWSGEFCNIKKNGELYWEAAIIFPIIDKNKRITHFVSIKEDITRQKEIDRKVQFSIIEAEERERLHFSQELHDGIGPTALSYKDVC